MIGKMDESRYSKIMLELGLTWLEFPMKNYIPVTHSVMLFFYSCCQRNNRGGNENMSEIPFKHRAILILFLFTVLLGASVSIDRFQTGGDASHRDINIEGDHPEAVNLSADGRLPSPYAHTERRIYILLVDCLRYETATDPDLMPHLNGLQNRSTYGYMRNSIDAVTVPSLKAAFTGVDGFSLFNVVANFKEGNTIPSVFTQLNREGVTISCYSDLSFKAFSRDITDYYEMDRHNWNLDDYNRVLQEPK